MSETKNTSDQPTTTPELQFGEEVLIEKSGFSFRPLIGFELEIDGSVYMYAEDGSMEISLCGGELEDNISIAELNDDLAAKFMAGVGEFQLIESGLDMIKSTSGFLNEIRFVNADEEAGLGRALICSPYLNQYFFILATASADYWQTRGQKIFDALKSKIDFHPQFKTEIDTNEHSEHPDLTIDTFEMISADEEILIKIEKGDISLLLAARTFTAEDQIMITEVTAPSGDSLYHYEPDTGLFESTVYEQPLIGTNGEVCFFFPRTNQQTLQPGDYIFEFATPSGRPLDEVQAIIRTGRALDLQRVNFNFWIATENENFSDPDYVEQFETDIRQALEQRLAPLNIKPGEITCLHPAPDELESFSTIDLAADLDDCSYMIAESVTNARALNLGLVDSIINSNTPADFEIKAASSGSPGMILAPASPHTCAVIRWPAFEDQIYELADEIIQQMIVFCAIDTHDIQRNENQSLALNREIAWRIRRHPLFYDAV